MHEAEDEEMAELLGMLNAMEGDFPDELSGVDLGNGDALLGWDDSGDELGAFNLLRRYGRRRTSSRAMRTPPARSAILRRMASIQMRKRAYVQKIAPAIPGLPAPGARNFPLGFGSFVFVNGGVTTTDLTANPQKPFKGARLVVVVNRSAGALAPLVTVNDLDVGTGNQLVSSQSLPAEGFAPQAYDVVLSLDPATPGILVVLGIGVTVAPPVGETISVSAMLIGNTIG